MKDKFGNILLSIFLIVLSLWAFYESAQELQESISCNSTNYECVYTKSCPFLTPSYYKNFYLQDISLERYKRLVKGSKGRTHTETDSYIVTRDNHIRISHKVFTKLSEYKQNPTGSLSYQNYQVGIIPLCILFFALGVYMLIDSRKKK